VTTLNQELEALTKQLHVDSELQKALEADMDEINKSFATVSIINVSHSFVEI
jgi:c-di-GMP-related signal transduction protein